MVFQDDRAIYKYNKYAYFREYIEVYKIKNKAALGFLINLKLEGAN